jgi:hypothetical protein
MGGEMKTVIADSAGGKALVISDNRRLSRAVGLALNRYLGAETVIVTLGSSRPQGRPGGDVDFELIVLALSSPLSEPVVMLARASLAEKIGQVPLLIVSDRAFQPDPESKIFYLGFPFDPHELGEKAREILKGESRADGDRPDALRASRVGYGAVKRSALKSGALS